jgi:hypothetical protein
MKSCCPSFTIHLLTGCPKWAVDELRFPQLGDGMSREAGRREAGSGPESGPPDEAWVTQRLNRLWPAHNAGFVELLIVLRRQFEGDLDAALILTVLSVGARSEDWAGILRVGEGDTAMTPTNTQSIAEITGIPRESVRRKLKALAERGWISRDASGRWQPTRASAVDLAPSSRAAIEYFVRIFRAARER